MRKRTICQWILISLTLALGFQKTSRATSSSFAKPTKSAYVPGNITLGGLFPIHSRDEDGKCTPDINEVLGIQRLEAMLCAVEWINKDDTILPGITLGMNAFDTCASETTALDRTVEEFITDQKCDMKKNEGMIGGRQVVGVVGPLYSSISVQVAHLLRLFKMPQISYDSTSSELSDKTKYEYFLRTAPSDFLQARAIVDIMKYFNWSYVSAVYSDDNYGRKGIEALSSEADKNGICIAVREKIPYSSDDKTLIRVLKNLVAEKRARVLIVFCSKKETITQLVRLAKSENVADHFQWIGSDSWLTVRWLGDLQPTVRGLISVRPKSRAIERFRECLFDRTPSSTDVNPWFKEFFQNTVKCNLLSNPRKIPEYHVCDSHDTLRNANLTIDSGVSRTINAVYAFAHALHNIQKTKCARGQEICAAMKETTGKDLLSELRGITFNSIDGGWISFEKNGDAPPKYDVYYFQELAPGSFKNVRVGEWSGNLSMTSANEGFPTFEARDSFCGTPCKYNEVKRFLDKQSCCWECATCTGNEFAFNKTHCKTCPRGYWPDSGQQRCVQLAPRYFTFNTDYVGLHLILPPLIVSILGIISVVFIAVIFVKYNKTPLVKASGRELSFLLLTGLFLCYSVLVVCLMRPSPYTCLLEFILDSLPFTICYAAVIVKTNRISRIFNRRNLTKRPQFIHPQSQICFSFSLVAVQVMLLTAFCILQLPREKYLYLSVSDVVLICATSDKDFFLSQIYNFVLIIICTYYAFKTRRSPMNFNEAKYIAFAMYCTCVLWLAFITVYLVQTDVMLKSCIRCLSVSLIATILLVSLFVPKVYIIIFRPQENRKRPTLPSHSLSSLNGEQGGPTRSQSALQNDPSDTRDCRQNEDKNDGRGCYRPRSSTDPKRFDSERRSWRYSLPPEQFSQTSEPRKLDNEEEMEMEMKILIERLSVLESLLNKQRHASGSDQTREIQGALKSCQGLMEEVNKRSECSIPESIAESDNEEGLCECDSNARNRHDNRSILMAYAQTGTNAASSRNFRNESTPIKSKNACAHRYNKSNGVKVPAAIFVEAKSKGDRENLVKYPMSPINRKSTSDA